MTVEQLEGIRQQQEAAWYAAGYTRQQIITMFKGWPENLGHAPYKWTVGDPPTAGLGQLGD